MLNESQINKIINSMDSKMGFDFIEDVFNSHDCLNENMPEKFNVNLSFILSYVIYDATSEDWQDIYNLLSTSNHSTFIIIGLNEISQKWKWNFKLHMDVIVLKICLISLKLNANVNVIPYEYIWRLTKQLQHHVYDHV